MARGRSEGARHRADDIRFRRALSSTCGLISLGLGLVVVVGHPVWRGGVMPVVVTLIVPRRTAAELGCRAVASSGPP